MPLDEFVFNYILHSSIGTTPFFTSDSFHPHFNVDIPDNLVNPSGEEQAMTLAGTHCVVHRLAKVQAQYNEMADFRGVVIQH